MNASLTALRFRSGEVLVTADAPFVHDRLNREPFITAVTDLLKAIREPFVISLNAPWGSGKTTTLRMLEPTLAAAGMTTVSFNAWEVDDATDPLIPLVATLHDRLLEVKGYGTTIDHAKVSRFKTLGSAIAKHGTIAAVKVATAGLLDLSAATEGIAKAVGEAAEEAGANLTGDLVDAFKHERQAAIQFHKLLHELIEHAQTTGNARNPLPLVLMIDELDRCRPTFAIAMLERVKHFFNVPGLVFVLSCDLEQMKASTRKVYGAELNAAEYLRRFIDLELKLPRARVSNMVDAMLSSCGADEFFSARQKYSELREDRQWILKVLESLATNFALSPRVVQRMVSRLMLVLRQTAENHYLDPIIAVFMIFLRIHDEQLLQKLVAGHMRADQVMEALRALSPNGNAFYYSHIGKLIEAHILYAHAAQHNYVQDFVQQTEQLDPNHLDAAGSRKRDVLDRLQSIRHMHFSRGGIDLRTIDQRINLISADIKEE